MKIVNCPVDRNAAVFGIVLTLTQGFYRQNVAWKTRTQDSEVLFKLKEIASFLP